MYNVITAISRNYPDIASHPEKYFFRYKELFFISIFYPTGEPILLGGEGWRLHCSSFAVAHYNFMSYFFVAAAISPRK